MLAIDDDEIEVEGELMLRGVTRPLSLKLARTGEGPDMWGGQRAGFATAIGAKFRGTSYIGSRRLRNPGKHVWRD